MLLKQMKNGFLVIEGLIYPSLTPLTLVDLLLLHFGINQGVNKSVNAKTMWNIHCLMSYHIQRSRKCISSDVFHCNADSGQEQQK